jgi:hypothetical protein
VNPDIIPIAAREARERAGACIDERRFVDAIAPAESAAALCPDWSSPWWILSVAYKHARRWEDTMQAADRAIALDPDDCEGPRWNAGIAATALGLWPRARAAWTSFGVDLPGQDGPIEMDLGATPIRVSPRDAPEVVWTKRIDPCRARILSVPLPESKRRYHDLVLHDGEQRGERRLGGQIVLVFDELDLLSASAFETWQVVVRFGSPEEHHALTRSFEDDECPVRAVSTSEYPEYVHALPSLSGRRAMLCNFRWLGKSCDAADQACRRQALVFASQRPGQGGIHCASWCSRDVFVIVQPSPCVLRVGTREHAPGNARYAVCGLGHPRPWRKERRLQ